ncbi:hypothetical protein HDU98_000393, partial [Podochytrium sp. JEL0797]
MKVGTVKFLPRVFRAKDSKSDLHQSSEPVFLQGDSEGSVHEQDQVNRYSEVSSQLPVFVSSRASTTESNTKSHVQLSDMVPPPIPRPRSATPDARRRPLSMMANSRPVSRVLSEFALENPETGSGRASPTSSAGSSRFDMIKGAIKKLVSSDRVINLAPAGDEGRGPWDDNETTSSPIPLWQLNPDALADKVSTVHVMTVGRPDFANNGEEQRRIQIFEHQIH